MALKIGMWLSLVEYLNGVQVVVGSNPAIPTNKEGPVFREGSRAFLFLGSKSISPKGRIRFDQDGFTRVKVPAVERPEVDFFSEVIAQVT